MKVSILFVFLLFAFSTSAQSYNVTNSSVSFYYIILFIIIDFLIFLFDHIKTIPDVYLNVPKLEVDLIQLVVDKLNVSLDLNLKVLLLIFKI